MVEYRSVEEFFAFQPMPMPLSDEDKPAARYELLLKEIKLVQTIDKLKADARKKLTEQTISKELGSMAAPKLWEMSDGSVKEV